MTTRDRDWEGRVFIGVSLDGFIARGDHDISWLTDPPRIDGHVSPASDETAPPDYDDFIAGIDTLVMGRLTYEKVLTFDGWPYTDLQVVVLSRTLDTGDDRIVIARSVDEVIDVLDHQGARGVYVDGGRVIQDFLRAGLIDELTISTAPVLIGDGIPLFGGLLQDVRLVHRGTATTDQGMVSSRYRVAPSS